MLEVWDKDWKNRCKFNFLNFILIWSIPPAAGEIVGRIFGFKFIGLVFGFAYSFAKTQYDYIRSKYFP